ncbi:hypothetical protein TNCV_1811251 [Trichonephila clavipes]|nr:hypothetical protein TNCV_1811251 [Trichonephila clavipes]
MKFNLVQADFSFFAPEENSKEDFFGFQTFSMTGDEISLFNTERELRPQFSNGTVVSKSYLEPWSGDGNDTRAGTPSPNFHTTPMGGRLSLDIFNVLQSPLRNGSLVVLGMTRRPRVH